MKTFLGILIMTAIVGVLIGPAIERYERSHDYPFGRLCDLYHTCQ